MADHPPARRIPVRGVVLGHIILISAQVNARTGVPVLEEVTFGMFAEVQRGVAGGFVGRTRHVERIRRPAAASSAENENAETAACRAQVEVQSSARWPIAATASSGSSSSATVRTLQTVAAEIIAAGATPDFRTVTIDKGTHEGVRPTWR